jgi:TonB-dependent SusC/RagA subfamily outer membrane receptor
MKIILTIFLCFVLTLTYSQEQNELPLDSGVKDGAIYLNPRGLHHMKTPMYLVDQIETPSEDLARIKLDDIESINIMKGPSALEAFGERAVNGVVIIKTKKAKSDSQEQNELLQDSGVKDGPVYLNPRGLPHVKTPMFLVDRIETPSEDIAKIRVDDIESINVMKGHSATEAFGERAVNGVVIIKTKKAKSEPHKME